MVKSIRHINEVLDVLDALERQLNQVAIHSSPAEEFEMVHKLALKVAGIVREEANRDRKRPLPLNVWSAIARVSPAHKQRAQEIAPFVQVRRRALASPTGQKEVTRALVERHRQLTLAHLGIVRAEVAGIEQLIAA